MRISEARILSALMKGGCIRTFYRTSSLVAGDVLRRIPDGYILEQRGERNELILTHTDFQCIEAHLTESETWERVVGGTLFGGSTWILRQEDIQ